MPGHWPWTAPAPASMASARARLPFLQAELGDTLDLMRQIKRALDPGNIFNPGKIFDM